MQVYFIDNDEYFKRRASLKDDKQKLFSDNDERMIFFTKGVIETVKKLNWSPDIIHLHGWFTSLFPIYLKTYYKDEPIFANSKIVTSVYAKDFDKVMSKNLHDKVAFDNIPLELISLLKKASFENLIKLSIEFSDGYAIADIETPKPIQDYLSDYSIPGLTFEDSQKEDAFVNFYSTNIL
jgi:starch synthase